MKKCWVVFVLILLLTGCDGQAVFETMSDDYAQPVMAQMQQISVSLPEEAIMPSMENGDSGKIYLCDGYTLTVQTMQAGDLDRTLCQTTGFPKDQLTVMETEVDGVKRYDCVWSAAGEGGDHVGRATVLDDGSYHYVVTVMAEFSAAGDLTQTWQDIMGSVTLRTD